MSSLSETIDAAWERRAELSPAAAPPAVRDAVEHAIAELDTGRARVAEKIDGQWVTRQWLKKAVLLSFRLRDNRIVASPGAATPGGPRLPVTICRRCRQVPTTGISMCRPALPAC